MKYRNKYHRNFIEKKKFKSEILDQEISICLENTFCTLCHGDILEGDPYVNSDKLGVCCTSCLPQDNDWDYRELD